MKKSLNPNKPKMAGFLKFKLLIALKKFKVNLKKMKIWLFKKVEKVKFKL